MKKIQSVTASLAIFLASIQGATAESNMTWTQAFNYLADNLKQEVPASYEYIELEYKNIPQDSDIEDSLQKLVYLDLLQNRRVALPLSENISVEEFQILHSKTLGKVTEKKNEGIKISIGGSSNTQKLSAKEKIFYDVLDTLENQHFDKDSLERDKLLDDAISGLAKGAGDTYTTYFPAIESEGFYEVLEGEYEGIGAYVEMNEPGKLIIVSPIVGSPSEAAGILGGDRVTHVDGKEITDKNPLREVVSWIKGPSGSRVVLTISREGKAVQDITVTRSKIILKDVEHEKLGRNTYYIQIKNFGERVDTEFKKALEGLKTERNINKIIIDLRNNPGGYLGEASTVLSYFVPKGEATAIIDYGSNDSIYRSVGYDLIDPNEYEIVILQNSGSASASEIMAGTIKDYYPETTIIGTQSFGKGSVQTLKNYGDGSTLKYTSAKWFTGKNRNGIDGIGITPDLELEFDRERWERFKTDNQLEKALDL